MGPFQRNLPLSEAKNIPCSVSIIRTPLMGMLLTALMVPKGVCAHPGRTANKVRTKVMTPLLTISISFLLPSFFQ
jgi:hypothetical protein